MELKKFNELDDNESINFLNKYGGKLHNNSSANFTIMTYFTKEMIKKEKGIIASEINMGYDQPYNRLHFEFYKSIFEKEKYRNLITGEVSDIKKIDLKDTIKTLGTFNVDIKLFEGVIGKVKIDVIAE